METDPTTEPLAALDDASDVPTAADQAGEEAKNVVDQNSNDSPLEDESKAQVDVTPSIKDDSVIQEAQIEENKDISEADNTSVLNKDSLLQDVAGSEPNPDMSEESQLINTESLLPDLDPMDVDKPEKIMDPTSVIEPSVMPTSKAGTFNLGVPGLSFSYNNVKTAHDGTKMVQIHQSQITPDQLQALQNNPNIKVVFRHIPSGRSFTKPPRHLMPTGQLSPPKKRKAYLSSGSLTSTDAGNDDVYNFDEGEDFGQGPVKMQKTLDMRARYNYGMNAKKKGRPRSIPDSTAFATSFMKVSKQQSKPAKVILTDLLMRINNPEASFQVKLHTSQINAEVLANMELDPNYKIILTSQREEKPVEVEQETEDTKEEAKEKSEEKEDEQEQMQTDAEQEQPDEQKEEKKEETDDPEEKKRLEEEKEAERKEREAARLRRLKEEEELMQSVLQTQKSRSGRVRKPSRFSLDIARLTKKKSSGTGGDSSADESEQEVKSPIAKPKSVLTPASISTKTPEPSMSESPKKKKRGRPRKNPPIEVEEEKEEDRVMEEEKNIPSKDEEEDNETSVEMEKHDSDTKEAEKEEQKEKEITESEKEETQQEEQKEKEITESEKEVTSTEDEVAAEKKEEKNKDKEETMDTTESPNDKPDSTEIDDVVSAEPDTSSDVKDAAEDQDETPADFDNDIEMKDEEEKKEVIDNKYRLRKLLEQCSADEINTVLLPEAFESINFGDFLLYKAGQNNTTTGKIKFPQIYKQMEDLHSSILTEAARYNKLVKRANKVGGDKRMEKVVLMPVYNRKAADALELNSTSIDAHICGIHKPVITQMIAANSFFITAKMDSPTIRLKLPEATAPGHARVRAQKRSIYAHHQMQKYSSNQQAEPDSTTPDQPRPYKRTYGNKSSPTTNYTSVSSSARQWNSNTFQVRKPTYLDQYKTERRITQSIAQSNYISLSSQDSLLQALPVDSSTGIMKNSVGSMQVTTGTSALAQLQATIDEHQQSLISTTNVTDPTSLAISSAEAHQIVVGGGEALATTAATDTSTSQAEQYLVTDGGVPISEIVGSGTDISAEGEVRKHLVPIGDGQYVELPEGYSLIQTDEGYIIGQPGSTFTQGEDGNVYVTNSDGTTAEISQQVVTEDANEAAPALLDQIPQT